MKTKVYYADTDAGGVVYYGNYLRWFEMARSDWLEHWGVSVADYARQGVLFAVRRVEVDYLAPAVLGDEVEVTVEAVETRRVRFTLRQQVIRTSDQAPLASALVTLACLTPEGRITQVPADMAAAMKQMIG